MNIREVVARELEATFLTIPEIKTVTREYVYDEDDVARMNLYTKPCLSITTVEQVDSIIPENYASGNPASVVKSSISFLITLFYTYAEQGPQPAGSSFDAISNEWIGRIARAYYSRDMGQVSFENDIDIEQQALSLPRKPLLFRPNGYLQLKCTVDVSGYIAQL